MEGAEVKPQQQQQQQQQQEGKKRIVLIGVDGSQSSDFAIDWYHKHFHVPTDHVILLNCAHLEMMHTSWNGTSNVFDHDAMSKLLTEEQKKIKDLVTRYEEMLKQIGMEGEVRVTGHGKPGAALCHAADELGARLLVVGCRGHGALHRLLGSVSDYVLHHSHPPVLVCRQPHQYHDKHHHHHPHHHLHDKHHHHHHHHKHDKHDKHDKQPGSPMDEGAAHHEDKHHEKHHNPFNIFHRHHKHHHDEHGNDGKEGKGEEKK